MSDIKIFTEAEINGKWLPANDPEAGINEIKNDNGRLSVKAVFTNKTGQRVRLGGIRFNITAFEGVPGKQLRLFREGWSMASASGTVRYGEKDFETDPEYRKFAVTDPENYDSDTPNRFHGEHVIVLNDRETGNCILAGFISSADQLTRFEIEPGESGRHSLKAFSSADGIPVDPDESVSSEELIIFEGSDGYGMLEEFASAWGKKMKALSWDHIPTGWCSWYYYFSKVTENDIMENIRFLADNKKEFPMEFIQLDDGYQAALGDWLTCNEKFPNGLEYIARNVREAGFKPGLWLAPFMVEERSELFTEHPEWTVKDVEGKVIWASEWRGSRVAALDGTHPGAQKYLRHVFSTLVEWGFEYVKLDFLAWACVGSGGCYHDKKATRAQALRRGLEAIREAMGDRFILGCTAPLGQVVGLMNGERIGTDITPYWKPDRRITKEAPAVPNVCRNVINRSYMNGRLWISDPDTHIARTDNNKLTENEVLLWTYALYMAGGMMLLSDRFETLAPKRAELSKLLLEAPGIFETRPLDFFEREYPSIWIRRDKKTGKSLLGIFNFEDESSELKVDLGRIEKGKTFSLKDFKTGKEEYNTAGIFEITLEPHSSRLFSIG